MGTPDGGMLVRVRNLSVDFRTGEAMPLHAVRGVSFDIPDRATVALVGESGSGKSVSALALLGLLPAANATVLAGSRIEYRGRNLLELAPRAMRALRGAEISMIFQEPMSSLNPVFTVGFQLCEVLAKHLGLRGREARRRAIGLLDEVGIPDPAMRMNAYPFQLSGGQQQRVMIAMAIACEPRLLIADEPTTALDVTVERQILKLVAELQKRREMAVLFITHDLALVAEIADRVVVLRDGEVREQGSVEQVFGAPQDAYTRALLACRPPLARRPRRLPVIEDVLRGGFNVDDIPEQPRGLRGDEKIVLEARHVAKSFPFRDGPFRSRAFQAVKDASFRLARGRTLGVVGESGSGKTTLALTLVRLSPASGGEVLFDGVNLLALSPDAAMRFKRRIQIVFQNPYASLNPRFTAGEILIEPMRIHAIGADENERRALARELLAKVGLPQSAYFKYAHEFSGGQRQRIAIARCLTMKPDVLICDEAVSALDVSVQAQLLNLLQDLQEEFHMSYLFISHDLAVVRYMADEVMVMNRGEIVEIAASDAIYSRPQHPYTRELVAAMPRGWRGAAAQSG
jgi:peptide/nickel transport system ATP-binding protein